MSRISNVQSALNLPRLLTPTKSWPEQGEPELRHLARALASQPGYSSPEIRTFEEAFGTMQGLPASHEAVAVTNGTHALQLAFEALDIGAGDYVVVPGLTWQ